MDNNYVNIYVDGSFSDETNQASWAFIIVENDTILYKNRGTLTNPVYNEGRQIAGECKAVIEAIKYCKENKKFGIFFYDYTGLRCWISDIWGEKPWKANKVYTQRYRDFCLENRDCIYTFNKVKAHTGNKWNEEVDELAKQA